MQEMREARLAAVVDKAKQGTGEVTTRSVMDLYRSLGVAVKRTTARADLKSLVRRGLLVQAGTESHRNYRVATAVTV